jgi:hypothetical protein
MPKQSSLPHAEADDCLHIDLVYETFRPLHFAPIARTPLPGLTHRFSRYNLSLGKNNILTSK